MPARLFTALVPPPEVVSALETFLEPRLDADPQLRWTRPESWHVTTAFMASVPDRSVDRLTEGLTRVAERTAPLQVELFGGGAFPNPSAAKLLYLAASPADPLGRLAAACRTAATRAGVEVDGARFTAHLTLARARRAIEATRWLRILDAFGPASWRSSELTLIESHLNDRGSRYEVVARFPFSGPNEDSTWTRDPKAP